jgi:antirestriction protein
MKYEPDDNPKLYCGTYGKYNNGSIAGKWMDLSEYEDAEEFFAACAELHKDEHDPEFMFQDYECFPRSMYSECMSSEDINKLIEFAKLGEDERDYVMEYLDEVDSSADIDSIEDYYIGNLNDIKGDSFMSNDEAYGYYCVENGLIDVPEHLTGYFDYESYGREQLQDIHVTESGYMFSNY